MTNTSAEYQTWLQIRQRCFNKKHRQYKEGTVFDPLWHSFEIFLDEVGRRPSDEHRLVRLDTAKGFTRDNVVWAKKGEVQTTRKAKTYTAFGKTMTLKEWFASGRCIPSMAILKHRVHTLKWDMELALRTPCKNRDGDPYNCRRDYEAEMRKFHEEAGTSEQG